MFAFEFRAAIAGQRLLGRDGYSCRGSRFNPQDARIPKRATLVDSLKGFFSASGCHLLYCW
jgi:hypothetical protein